jgi:hypothetical protein
MTLDAIIKWYDNADPAVPNFTASKSYDIDSCIELLKWLLPKSQMPMIHQTNDQQQLTPHKLYILYHPKTDSIICPFSYTLYWMGLYKLTNIDDLNRIYDVFVSYDKELICDIDFWKQLGSNYSSLYVDIIIWWLTHSVDVCDLSIILAVTNTNNRYELFDKLMDTNVNATIKYSPINESCQVLHLIQRFPPQSMIDLMEFYYQNRYRLQFINMDSINHINLHNDTRLLDWLYSRADEIKFNYNESLMDYASRRGQVKILDWLYERRDTIDLKYTCESIDSIIVSECYSLDWWLSHSHSLELKYTDSSIDLLHDDDNYHHLLWWLEHRNEVELRYTTDAIDYINDANMLDVWFDFRDSVELKYTTLAFSCQESISIMEWWIEHSDDLELKIDVKSLNYIYNRYKGNHNSPTRQFLLKHADRLGLQIE